MNPQGLNTINLENIFIRTNNTSKRSLKSVIESETNNLFKKKLISEDVYRSLGGKKDYSKDVTIETISLMKSDTECLGEAIICHSCKDGDKKAMTPNLPGFSCDAYLRGESSKYSVRTKCANCKSDKYSYFSFDRFPKHLQEAIRKSEIVERKKLKK